ncbi:uncharacterized protein LOC127862314 isoform X2 [Dreissena polymorpha]|uniref:uncharacterized protein LOC127862314 isoform X2 n=1 Tax=Dreissena polymorpha TaxID=45954 RepID=UPI00226544D0|nr:uncharacterized protein LOC127862314 isoform X2 [Dreissena polymorpha]
MDSLLVDLDKVLDDFEAEEDLAPGSEIKPSGYRQYLEQTETQTWNAIENLQVSDAYKASAYVHGGHGKKNGCDQLNEGQPTLRYDFPYEPETFDLSEADFSPSPLPTEGTYKGSLSYSKENGIEGSQVIKEQDRQPHQQTFAKEPGTPYENVKTNFFRLSQSHGGANESCRYEINMDTAPISEVVVQKCSEVSKPQVNGFESRPLEPPPYSERNERPTLGSHFTSTTFLSSDSSCSNPDKYPIQCNTPQTPKENPLLSSIESQFSMQSNVHDSKSTSATSSDNFENIPKLDFLKQDLATTVWPKTDHSTNMQRHLNGANSFPASLHMHFSQNTPGATNSLPSDYGSQTSAVYNNQLGGNLLHTQELNLSVLRKEPTSSEPHVLRSENKSSNFASQISQISEKNYLSEVNNSVPETEYSSNKEFTQNFRTGISDINQQEKSVLNPRDSLLLYTKTESSGLKEEALAAFTDHPPKYPGKYGLPVEQVVGFGEVDEDMVVDEKELAEYLGDSKLNGATVNYVPKHELIEKAGDLITTGALRDSLTSKPGCDRIQMDINEPIEQTTTITDAVVLVPVTAVHVTGKTEESVVPDQSTNLSPSANISLDSGCASMNDNLGEAASGDMNEERTEDRSYMGARPKDSRKVNRPNSLSGLSTVDLNGESPFVSRHGEMQQTQFEGADDEMITDDAQPFVENLISETLINESRQMMETESGIFNGEQRVIDTGEMDTFQQIPVVDSDKARSSSPTETGMSHMSVKRPNSLNLSSPPTMDSADLEEAGDGGAGEEVQDVMETGQSADQQAPAGAEGYTDEAVGGVDPSMTAQGGWDPSLPPPYSSSSTLGQVAPQWIPDSEAPVCMSCSARFTFTKRRHHCRACGKVYCSVCCNMKARLPHLRNQEGRVCVFCFSELAAIEQQIGSQDGYPPHPNNPSDYCSTVPPTQGVVMAPEPPPSVLVPVLKRDEKPKKKLFGSNRRAEPKQVMFSDGIRPGGDLTELDGHTEAGRANARKNRPPKRTSTQGPSANRPRKGIRTQAEMTLKCLIPEDGLPPISVPKQDGPGKSLVMNPKISEFLTDMKDEDKEPVIFAVNTNLYISLKIVTLDCCVNRTVWCFATRGMSSVGQEEIAIILECNPEEHSPPLDIFKHLNNVFEEASKGNEIQEMGHSIFNESFLDSRDHGGFLYIRSTFQCVQKLPLPNPPFLFGILLQKWETPWAKVFPLRLLLRLGAEYRYYPCPLISTRNRKPVFYEIGHTIMNLLADFRNYQYMLPTIRGLTIHMEDKVTKINFPRNRYDELMKVVTNSNEHVMSIAATFSSEADSHLVCIQNDEGNYQTQAINIQNKPRKVTGASFVVFNGALKSSSGLTAKSSIVEDGLMVQITADSMLALKQAIKDMQDYPISCGLLGAGKPPEETVIVQWVDEDKNVNIGVKSPVDNMALDGIESLKIHSMTNYVGEKYTIRWTEIFFIQNEERGSPKWDPVDLSRIGGTVATACCQALLKHLEPLKDSQLDRIGLRISLGNDQVGYEAGANGDRLPDVYMNDLDNELVPVIHRATQPDTMIVLELIFEVLE